MSILRYKNCHQMWTRSLPRPHFFDTNVEFMFTLRVKYLLKMWTRFGLGDIFNPMVYNIIKKGFYMLCRNLFVNTVYCFLNVVRRYFARLTATAQATVAPTMGLLPMPISPIISTCAGTEELPANCASLCIRPIVSVMP